MHVDPIIALIALVLIIGFDALGDKIKFHWNKFVFNKDWGRFWQPASWEDKYERGAYGELLMGADGEYIRKTFKFLWWDIPIPVIFTNGWHLIKAAKIFCILLPISILVSYTWGYWWLNQIIAIMVWAILFEWIFSDLLEKEREDNG